MKNVLWTGGWDSTFRVLDLVILKGREVQPFYVFDSGRGSTAVELETMQQIKNMVKELKPGAEQLIKDYIFIKIEDIPQDSDFTAQYNILLSQSFMGSQYDWLGRYVKSIGLNNLELCIHKDDKAEGFVRDDVHYQEDGNDGYYKLNELPKNPALAIFNNYNFPLLNMTKVEMGEIAKKNGFSHIMEQTWFCFNPQAGRKPCGYCNPCIYTREEGLGRRVPRMPVSRAIYRRAITVLRKIKKSIS